ncbi:probable mannosyltransferase Ktr5p [Monosporozyma unispora]|nr:alpha-1,2-mannosyltransferase (Kre5) [Kazachstania unispora]
MSRRVLQSVRTFSPLTIILIISFIISVPILIYSSEPDVNVGLLNSYQATDTHRDSVFNKETGCNDIEQYLQQEGYIRQNATILMLTRNHEIDDVISSLDSIESHFNQWFQYPYTFLNDVPFEDEFEEKIREHTDAKIEFGVLESEEWEFPEPNEEKGQDMSKNNATSTFIDDVIRLQGDRGILYGNMKSYHQMCRFYSGKFYHNKLVKQYDWYWRLEPDIDFFCDLTYDPFYEMMKHKKRYGFTIMIPELYWTIPNLFRVTMGYIQEKNITLGTLWNIFTTDYHVVNNDVNDTRDDLYHEVDSDTVYLDKYINEAFYAKKVVKDRLLIDQFVREGYGINENEPDYHGPDNIIGLKKLIKRAQEPPPIVVDKFNNLEYNLCHFWSNFEIAHMSIYNDPTYDQYFEYLEKQEGFWKERWGDAPVHSLGLSLLLDVEDVHYFRDIGYRHDTLQHCPKNHKKFLETPYQSKKHIRKHVKYDDPYEYGTGCRCKCPRGKRGETEDHHSFCINKWFDITHRDSTGRDAVFNLTKLNIEMAQEIDKERFLKL